MANIKSTRIRPEKPYPEFPLFAHNNGSWCRKIRGKIYSFGPWENPDAALKKHNKEYPYLKAGVPIPERFDGETVESVCVAFLKSKELRHSKEKRWFGELVESAKYLTDYFGRQRPIDSIGAAELDEISAKLTGKHAPSVAKNRISRIRQILNFAQKRGLAKVVLQIDELKLPSKAEFRKHRSKQPKKLWKPGQYRKLLSNADPAMKAMLYLAINGGFHNEDIRTLPKKALNFRSGWLDFPREKTYVERMFKLWPETIEAIHAFMKLRPNDSDYVFLTDFGNQFSASAIAHKFRDLRKECKLKEGTFSWGRHTFETVGELTGDHIAVKGVMGHVDPSISAEYRETIFKRRLVKVTDEVRKWLQPEKIK